jgi:hypothetical protein
MNTINLMAFFYLLRYLLRSPTLISKGYFKTKTQNLRLRQEDFEFKGQTRLHSETLSQKPNKPWGMMVHACNCYQGG